MPEIETADATSEDTEQVETETTETESTETTEGQTDLGDAGKKALDAMKAERNAAKADARKNAAELQKLRDELALKDKPAEEQALETARAEARTETLKAANQRILKADLRAAATGKLADPADAQLYLNLDDFDVNDDGETDSGALSDAIDELLAKKPHLAVPDARKFAGTADQGAKGRQATVTQLTDADIQNWPYQKIEAARKAGQLDRLMGSKH